MSASRENSTDLCPKLSFVLLIEFPLRRDKFQSYPGENLSVMITRHPDVAYCSHWWGFLLLATSGFRGEALGKRNTSAYLTVNFACNFAHKRSEYRYAKWLFGLLHLLMPVHPDPITHPDSSKTLALYINYVLTYLLTYLHYTKKIIDE